MTVAECQRELGKDMIHMSEVAATLLVAKDVGKNVILYGPRGHAKSQICQGFIDLFYTPDEVFKGQMGSGSKKEDFLGNLKINKLAQEGILEYDYENSFMNRKAAIFEEMFQAPKGLLTTFKDILISKEFCQGTKVCYKMQTEFIIATSNVDPKTWAASDPDLVAFNDRFPFQVSVQWPTYTASDYSRMFEIVLKDSNDYFAQMMEVAYNKGKLISPRTAVIACTTYNKHGLKGIRNIEGIDPSLFDEFEYMEEKKVAIIHIKKTIKEIKGSQIFDIKKSCTAEQIAKQYAAVRNAKNELSRYTAPSDGDLVLEVADMYKKLGESEKTLNELLLKSLGVI